MSFLSYPLKFLIISGSWYPDEIKSKKFKYLYLFLILIFGFIKLIFTIYEIYLTIYLIIFKHAHPMIYSRILVLAVHQSVTFFKYLRVLFNKKKYSDLIDMLSLDEFAAKDEEEIEIEKKYKFKTR